MERDLGLIPLKKYINDSLNDINLVIEMDISISVVAHRDLRELQKEQGHMEFFNVTL